MIVGFVIGAIIVVLIFLLYAMVGRRRNTAEIDQLDMKKTELLHRPVNEELVKVKRLNMTGQTEQLFERWRAEWDEVVTQDIPAVDEQLMASEAMSDKLRFGAAKKTNHEAKSRLDQIEKKVTGILTELDQLVGSEEKNRAEGEEMYIRQREAKKRLLAHRHTFGKAAGVLEVQLDVIAGRFDKFADLTEDGNYLEARELLMEIQAGMQLIEHKIARIPVLMTEVNQMLKGQLSVIEKGYREMKQEGYLLDHLQVEKELASLERELERGRELLIKTEAAEAELLINEAKDSIDSLYDLLEKEAMAKQIVAKDNNETGYVIEDLEVQNKHLIEETNRVKQSYQLNEEETGVPNRLKDDLYHLKKQYEILDGRMQEEQTAYSFLREELQEIQLRSAELKKEQEGFSAFLQTLRKDEVQADEELLALKNRFQHSSRQVKKSNLPGIPAYYRELQEDARVRLQATGTTLNEKPLNMKAVQENLESAKGTVDHLSNKTNELLEQVALSERMIQFGNRYRRTHPSIVQKLDEAEVAFRRADYSKALELCSLAIEKVDAKGLKRFEAQYREGQM